MATLYRRDEDVTDFMGNPVSGVAVALASQPANTTSFPPTPAVQLFADAAGKIPLTGAPQTDAYGHCEYYAPAGIYTVVYYSTQIATPTQTLVLPDQVISGPTPPPPSYNNDSTANGTISPLPDSVETQFNLSAVPVTNSLVLCLNGIVETGYTLLPGLLTVVLPSAPPTGALITAHYQVA